MGNRRLSRLWRRGGHFGSHGLLCEGEVWVVGIQSTCEAKQGLNLREPCSGVRLYDRRYQDPVSPGLGDHRI